MIVEGIVWRLVLDNEKHPGDPLLEKFGVPRTEYLLDDVTDPVSWTVNRDAAKRFPTHCAAEVLAAKHHWHAAVAGADEADIPERQRPLNLPPPIPPMQTLRKTRPRRRRPKSKPGRKSWVIESYG